MATLPASYQLLMGKKKQTKVTKEDLASAKERAKRRRLSDIAMGRGDLQGNTYERLYARKQALKELKAYKQPLFSDGGLSGPALGNKIAELAIQKDESKIAAREAKGIYDQTPYSNRSAIPKSRRGSQSLAGMGTRRKLRRAK